MVQTLGEIKKKKEKAVVDWRVHHTTMRGRKQEKNTKASRKVWVGDVETEWGEPISQKAMKSVLQHLKAKLKKYGRHLTQAAAVNVTLKDRKLQRCVNSEGLQMQASDMAWAWVVQQVRDGRAVPGEQVWLNRVENRI